MWMEIYMTVIQSDISHKEKNKYIIAHIRNVENGIDDVICKTEIKTLIENKHMDTKMGKGMEWDELGDWDWHIYTTDAVYKTDN